MANALDQFVVDWPVDEGSPQPPAVVMVRNQARDVGLYRVKHFDWHRMTLSHGGISFPVGTQLTLEDYQGLLPQSRCMLDARVVGNDRHGIHVTW